MASDGKNDIIPSVKKVSVVRSFGSEFKKFLSNTQSNQRSSTLAPNGSPNSDGFRGQHSLETRNASFGSDNRKFVPTPKRPTLYRTSSSKSPIRSNSSSSSLLEKNIRNLQKASVNNPIRSKLYESPRLAFRDLTNITTKTQPKESRSCSVSSVVFGNQNTISTSKARLEISKASSRSNISHIEETPTKATRQIGLKAQNASTLSTRLEHEQSLSSSTLTAFHDSGISKLDVRPDSPRTSMNSKIHNVNTIRAHSASDQYVKSSNDRPFRKDDRNAQDVSLNSSFGLKSRNFNNVSNTTLGINLSASHSNLHGESFASLDASFSRVVTSTPKSFFPINYSMQFSTQDEPMDLTTASDSSQALCLALPKAAALHENRISPLDLCSDNNFVPLDLRAVKNLTPIKLINQNIESSIANLTPIKLINQNIESSIDSDAELSYVHPDQAAGLPHHTELDDGIKIVESKADSEDPDWNPDINDNESDDDESEDGDPTLLNDLTIYEYFQNYQTLISDDEFEENSEDEVNPRKRSVNNEDTDLPTKRTCRSSGEPIRTTLTNESTKIFNNISIQGADNIEKEVVQMKISKQQLRHQNKQSKEKGLQYTRQDGTMIPARSIKPPCKCKRNCGKKYSDVTRTQLLLNLLKLKMSGQNQFLASHISVTKTARPKVINSRRAYSRVYHLPAVEGQVKVCKAMFMATFDIRDRKIRTIAAKKLAGAGIAPDDGRLQNESRLTVSAEHMQYIKKHMLSFPAYTSHYGRAKSDRLYLSSDLNVAKMHQLYQETCSTEGFVPVAYNTYRIIFNSMNFSFRKPKQDTCDVCDKLRVEIKTKIDDVEKQSLEKQQADHQQAAQRVYEEKRCDMQRSKSDATVRVASFDLQKQLPTPYLTCGRTFYSRQLYTLNLTMFASCLGENTAMCYIWDETKARRGSQEIGSCIMKDLLSIPSGITEVIYYSDRCGGQNLNKNIVFMFCYMIEQFAERGRSLTIEHKFMRTGHSHMEVDTIHAAIERTKKKTSIDIETPRDWVFLIASVRRSIPFQVFEMAQHEFKSIKDLSIRYHIPRCNMNGGLVKFKDIMVFKYSTDHPQIVQYKKDVSEDSFESMKLTTEDGLPNAEDIILDPIENHPIPLSAAKLKDLRNLMPYIKQKEYYSTFLKTLQEPKRGRRPKSNVEDHFESDMYDQLESDEENN